MDIKIRKVYVFRENRSIVNQLVKECALKKRVFMKDPVQPNYGNVAFYFLTVLCINNPVLVIFKFIYYKFKN